MRRSLAWYSAPVSFVHVPSWADFITITSGFRFSVHTVALRHQDRRDRSLAATRSGGSSRDILESVLPATSEKIVQTGNNRRVVARAERCHDRYQRGKLSSRTKRTTLRSGARCATKGVSRR